MNVIRKLPISKSELALVKPDSLIRRLFHLNRIFKDHSLSLTALIEHLMEELKTLSFPTSLKSWDADSLNQARHFAEEIITSYVSLLYDPSQVPVTYYKREKWIRKHLDQQFSILFKEIEIRAKGMTNIELITEEPIYYLLQKAREKSFPKGPKSKKRQPHLATLKIRFHVDLSRSIDSPEPGHGRKVLMPFEI